MNLDVLIFLKTYVYKHESKHKRYNIEPTQKNWPIDHSTLSFGKDYLFILKHVSNISNIAGFIWELIFGLKRD